MIEPPPEPERIWVSYDARERRALRLERELRVATQYGDAVIPAGFCWDGISSKPCVRTGRGGLVHDWYYQNHLIRRWQADFLFWQILRQDGVGRVQAWVMWLSVRAFGGLFWNKP